MLLKRLIVVPLDTATSPAVLMALKLLLVSTGLCAAESSSRAPAAEIDRLDDRSPAAAAGPATANDRAELLELSVGWRGYYKLGSWTPVTLQIRSFDASGPATIALAAVDGDDLECVFEYPDLVLQAGRDTAWRGWVRWGRQRSGLRVELKQEGRIIAQRRWRGSQLPPGVAAADELPAGLAADARLLVTIGSWPALTTTVERRTQAAGETMTVVEVASDDLPEDPIGFDGVDLVIIPAAPLWQSAFDSVSEPTAASAGRASHKRWQALRDWVRLGGRVLMFGAVGLDRAAPADHALSQLLPGRIVRVGAQRQTAALEGFVGGGQPLSQLRRSEQLTFSLPVAVLESPVGRTVVVEGTTSDSVPLVVHHALALGHVVYVALDLDQFPFTEWANTSRCIDRLLDLTLGVTEQQQEGGGKRIAYAGYEDLSGQLRVSLDQFPGVAVTSFSWVALLIGMYILAIGPMDYWLLRRFGKRFVWTWLTFPLTVILASAGAVALARNWKGNDLRVNQVDVVDWDVTTGLARGTHWFQLYSPQSVRWSGELELDVPWSAGTDGARWLTWLGLPGSSFGGLDNPPSRWGADLAYQSTIQHSSSGVWSAAISGLPMDAASSRGLSGRWWHTLSRPSAGQLQATPAGELTGTVRNPFDRPLQHVWLLHGRWVYELDRLSPGDTWTLDATDLPKNLEYLLTQRRVVDGKDRGTPWNPQSTDVTRILQIMAFHGAAGGNSYTGLAHRYQSDLDLSQLVHLNRAILVGWSDETSGQLRSAAQTLSAGRQWSMYRLIVPVAQSD